ncbi:CPBP family glutamic-type intramembrane protease [Kitasatospora griseola]|uniref:CPBP family glutamic-type intramembrane protease n=1 Tax=Kitasatospora griseola TaxID=2064 RepID=UPI0037F879B2
MWGILALCAYAPVLADLAYRADGRRAPFNVTSTIECAGVLAAAAVTVWLNQGRTRRGWRDPVTIAAVIIALARAHQLYDVSGASSVTVLRLLLAPAVLLLLAAELVRRTGGVAFRATWPTWRTVTGAVEPALLYILAMYVATVIAVAVAEFGHATDQVVDLGMGHTATGVLVVDVVSNAVVEEVVLAGGLCAIGLALRVPAAAMIAVGAAARLVLHLYMGPPAIGAVLVGAAATGLYLHRRRVLPLIAAHALYDCVRIYMLLHGSA